MLHQDGNKVKFKQISYITIEHHLSSNTSPTQQWKVIFKHLTYIFMKKYFKTPCPKLYNNNNNNNATTTTTNYCNRDRQLVLQQYGTHSSYTERHE